MRLERNYQPGLIKRIRAMFPGCVILKNDSSYLQGVPDLVILYRDKWAMLEVKKSANEPKQPNQDYYVGVLDEMSFAAFIYPSNEEVILRELQDAFGVSGITRDVRRQ